MANTVEGLPGSTADIQLNARNLLEHAARGHREQEVVTAYAGGNEVTTYAEMWENVQRMGHVLEEGVDGDDIDLEVHLMQYVDSGEIEKWWILDETVVIEDIPKTSVGKYDKKSLRDRYQDILLKE